jgi:NAD(P)-dependent dehydrogenase (short-subunit alcohol dehydrogenase family)
MSWSVEWRASPCSLTVFSQQMGSAPVYLDNEERVAIVTGAGGGIGRATVDSLIDRGWKVVAVDRMPTSEFGSENANVRYMQADVADAPAMVAVADRANEWGPLRGCVANAGVIGEGFDGFLASKPQEWRSTLEVNVIGTLTTFHSVARHLKAAGGGRMSATASIAGIRPEADVVAYSASKAAVISIVKSLALELGDAGIAVNGVAPGPVGTAMQDAVIAGRRPIVDPAPVSFGKRYDEFRHNNRPFRRLATPQEVGNTFGWLLSDEAAYITGHVIVLDGGGALT